MLPSCASTSLKANSGSTVMPDWPSGQTVLPSSSRAIGGCLAFSSRRTSRASFADATWVSQSARRPLKPGRKRWRWLGKDGVGLVHGRLVGILIDIREEVVTSNLSKTIDFDARKKAAVAGDQGPSPSTTPCGLSVRWRTCTS